MMKVERELMRHEMVTARIRARMTDGASRERLGVGLVVGDR